MTRLRSYATPEIGIVVTAAVLLVIVAFAYAMQPWSPTSSQTDLYNCGDFGTQARAQSFLELDHTDPHRLDRDGDGRACEWLR